MKYIIKESQLVDIIKRSLLEARGGNQVNGVEDVEDPRTIYGSNGSQPWHTQGETPTLPVVVISNFHDYDVYSEVIDLVSNPKLYAKKLKGKEIVFDRISPNTNAPITTIMEPLTLKNGTHWAVFANIPLEEMLHTAKTNRNFASIVSLLVLLFICIIMILTILIGMSSF